MNSPSLPEMDHAVSLVQVLGEVVQTCNPSVENRTYYAGRGSLTGPRNFYIKGRLDHFQEASKSTPPSTETSGSVVCTMDPIESMLEERRDEDAALQKNPEEEEPFSIPPSRWQVVLLRAVKNNDLEAFIDEASLHSDAIHEKFTKEMHQWELEWESQKWYEFVSTTAVYIASAYTRPAIVQWLLENGAAPDEACYSNQRPIEVVGQCRPGDTEGEAQVRDLLQRPRIVLKAPPAPQVQVKAGPEDILVAQVEVLPQDDPTLPPVEVTRRVRQRVVKAKLVLDWRAHWLPNGTQFEVRVREAGAQDWKCHRVHSAHKTLELLPLNTHYDVQVRAQNVAGWSPWSPLVSATTPAASTR